MGKGAVRATSALVFLLSLAQAAIAIAIVYLITRRLYKQEVDTDNRTINTECGLDKRGDVERDLCEWGIGGVAATFAVLLATSLCLVRPPQTGCPHDSFVLCKASLYRRQHSCCATATHCSACFLIHACMLDDAA